MADILSSYPSKGGVDLDLGVGSSEYVSQTDNMDPNNSLYSEHSPLETVTGVQNDHVGQPSFSPALPYDYKKGVTSEDLACSPWLYCSLGEWF